MTNLVNSYLTALQTWLAAAATADEPADLTNAHICVGRYQDSPEKYDFIVSLHENDPKDPSQSASFEWRHTRDIAENEFAEGCTEYWYYRFTAHIQAYFTRKTYSQTEAADTGAEITQWLRNAIGRAGLLVGISSYNEVPLNVRVRHIEVREGGGPTNSYIYKSAVFFEILATVD